jgi:RNA-directed DNA polymerase
MTRVHRNTRGKFQLCRKTRRDRMQAKFKEIKEELRRRRHQPIPEQGAWLKQVVAGFFVYHAVPTNSRGHRQLGSCRLTESAIG